MNFYNCFLLLLFLVLQNVGYTQENQYRDCFICKGDKHGVHERPYKDFTFKSELPFIASAVGLGITSQLINAPEPLTLADINALDPNTINSFDRYAIRQSSNTARNVSDFFLTGVLVLPAIFISNHHTRKDLVPLVAMSLEIILTNYSVTEVTKRLASRTRPLAYNPDFTIEEKMGEDTRLSFFSGHTSHTAALSFFMAKVMTDYHPHTSKGFRIGIWTFAAAIPAVTGYLRIRAGRHFPTDTITGYIAGGLVGILIPHFHKKRANKKLKVSPSISWNQAAISLQF